MDEIYLTSEELAEYPVEEFFGKWTFNNKTCGTGKSRKIHEIIDYGVTHQLKMMVCLPTHANVEEFMSRMTGYRDQAIELWGKPAYCQLRNDADAYLIGCKNCTHKTSCLYIGQFTMAREKPVIFIVPHHLYLVQEYNPDILIIDESIEKLAHKGIKIPERLQPQANLHRVNCNTCMCRNKCSDWRKEYRGQRGCYFTLYKTLEMDGFEPESLEEHFFKYNYDTLDNIYAVEDDSGNHVIIGDTPLDFLQQIETVVFNCATTKLSVAEKMFNREFEIIILDGERLENRIFLLEDLMTKTKTQEELENAEDYFKVLNIPMDDKTLIYTKKEFESHFRENFPEVKTGHYGDSRGYNKHENCENIIVFGRYGLTPAVQMLLSLRDYNFEEIEWFEKAEELQAMHRIRPIRDENKVIYLLSNSLKDVVEPTDYLNINSLKIGTEMLNGAYEDLTKSMIYEKIKGKGEDKIRAIDTLESTGKINSMKGRGKKLKLID
ncbi:MAG: hypothetical protein HWN80_17155 [Candidatus Lokiarchaeota archaeon]|nr:hypothetical protein [Candidatus Lokiarchaeota archaeon]